MERGVWEGKEGGSVAPVLFITFMLSHHTVVGLVCVHF